MSACRRRLLCFSEETVAQAASITDRDMGLELDQNVAVCAKICAHVCTEERAVNEGDWLTFMELP